MVDCSIIAVQPDDLSYCVLHTVLRFSIYPSVVPCIHYPDNWDAYNKSLYIVFLLYDVGSVIVEMVVGTTRKPSSLEVNFVTLFMLDLSMREAKKPNSLEKKSHISLVSSHQLISKEKSDGTDKVQE